MSLPNSSPTVQSLKAQGNESYKKGNYNEAIQFYSNAITLSRGSPDSERILICVLKLDELFNLLSSRCASYIQICDFGRAELDVNACFRIRPGSKAHARRAEVCSHLQRFESAITAYGKAAELATNESTKLRMLESQKLIKVLQTQGDPVSVRFGRNKPSVVLARRNRCTLLEEVCAAGSYCSAGDDFVKAFKQLDKEVKELDENRCTFEPGSKYLDILADALCADSGMWHWPIGNDINLDLTSKLRSMNNVYADSLYKVRRFIKDYNMKDAERTVETLINESRMFGTHKSQDAFRFLLRHLLLDGLLFQAGTEEIDAHGVTVAAKIYSYLLALIDSAQATFLIQPRSKNDKFICYIHLGTFKLLRKLSHEAMLNKVLTEASVRQIAEKMIEATCNSYDFIDGTLDWSRYKVNVLSEANSTLAHLDQNNMLRSSFRPHPKSLTVYYDHDRATSAANKWKLAFKDLPLDHVDGPFYRYSALACQLKAGGVEALTVKQLFDTCAEIEQYCKRAETWFGKTQKKNSARGFVLSVLKYLTNWLQDQDRIRSEDPSLKEEWNRTIKAVPVVVLTNNAVLPHGFKKLEGIDADYAAKLDGDISTFVIGSAK